MTRKEELLKIFENVEKEKLVLISQLIDEVVFLEEQLTELKKYPFIKIHPTDPTLQKSTVAGKQYKELSQSYINAIKVLMRCKDGESDTDDSPLRAYLKLIQES